MAALDNAKRILGIRPEEYTRMVDSKDIYGNDIETSKDRQVRKETVSRTSAIGNKLDVSNDLNNILSYKTISNSYARLKAKSVHNYNFIHTYDSDDLFDMPGQFIFKLIFYFNDEADDNGLSGGLLNAVDAEESVKKLIGQEIHSAKDSSQVDILKRLSKSTNSALFYLLANGETERAEYLNTFLELLSDINVKSPWYWQTLSQIQGLDARKDGNDWNVDNSNNGIPYSIEIGCLQDSVDTRIGTLLSAYKAACFSQQLKKEIVPANLRKFNMGIYIANAALFHHLDKDKSIGTPGQASYKYFELRGCEIDPNGSYVTDGITNVAPFEVSHKLKINYSSIYEETYNEYMGKLITDLVKGDFSNTIVNGVSSVNVAPENDDFFQPQDNYDAKGEKKEGLFTKLGKKAVQGVVNAGTQLATTGINFLDTKLTRAMLGNIYTVSGSKVISDFKNLANGNVLGTVRTIQNYKRNLKGRPESNITTNNIFGTPEPDTLLSTEISPINIPAESKLLSGSIYQSYDDILETRKEASRSRNIYNNL